MRREKSDNLHFCWPTKWILEPSNEAYIIQVKLKAKLASANVQWDPRHVYWEPKNRKEWQRLLKVLKANLNLLEIILTDKIAFRILYSYVWLHKGWSYST